MKVATRIASFKLWPLPESYKRRTISNFGSYSQNSAHVILFKRWKWFRFKNRSLLLLVRLVNGTATLFISSSRWSLEKIRFRTTSITQFVIKLLHFENTCTLMWRDPHKRKIIFISMTSQYRDIIDFMCIFTNCKKKLPFSTFWMI